MQNFTLPFLYPKMVPVRKDEEEEVDKLVGALAWFVVVLWWFSSWMKLQLHVGIRSSMMVRRSRHVRTCLWHSTVVTLAAMWVDLMLLYVGMVDIYISSIYGGMRMYVCVFSSVGVLCWVLLVYYYIYREKVLLLRNVASRSKRFMGL